VVEHVHGNPAAASLADRVPAIDEQVEPALEGTAAEADHAGPRAEPDRLRAGRKEVVPERVDNAVSQPLQRLGGRLTSTPHSPGPARPYVRSGPAIERRSRAIVTAIRSRSSSVKSPGSRTAGPVATTMRAPAEERRARSTSSVNQARLGNPVTWSCVARSSHSISLRVASRTRSCRASSTAVTSSPVAMMPDGSPASVRTSMSHRT